MSDPAAPERGRGWLIFLGSAGILLLCVCALSVAVVLALGGSVFAFMSADQVESEIAVEAPARVERGSEFVISVRIHNTSGEEMLLDSVDVAQTYLEGVTIAQTEPPYRDSIQIFGYTSYDFRRPIPVGGNLELELQALALQAGDYRGEIDICLNAGFSCRTFQVRTMIVGD